MNKKSIIAFIHNSLNDPLFSGTGLTYFKKIAEHDQTYEYHIITFEQKKHQLTPVEIQQIKQELSKHNIYWYPLKWHGGSLILIKKIYSLLQGFLLTAYLRFKTKAKLILTLGNIAGAFGYIYSRILGIKFFEYTYEPHSEFLADFGLWNKKSLKYKLLNKMEYVMGVNGDYIATGTNHMSKRLKNEWKSKAKIFVLPSCVDEDKFQFSETARTRIRKQLRIENRTVFLYLGKFGGIYYKSEIAELCKTLCSLNKNHFILIVTPDDKIEINGLFDKFSLTNENYHITESSFEGVQDYISAADIGIVALPPLPSQKYRSPIKVGEYLMCGLPYIVCKGISEDDSYAEQYNIGVVVKNFSEEEILKASPEIDKLLTEDKTPLRNRARKAGIQYRGIKQAVEVFRKVFEDVFEK